MCWTTFRKLNTKTHIAKRKIEVWKFYIKRSYVNQGELLMSPWRRDNISQNMRHNILIANGLHGEHLHIECTNLHEWSIYSGFHSLQKEKFHRKISQLTEKMAIEGGIYVFHQTLLDMSSRVVVIQCFIPAGAEYYLNEFGEYVSNKIIIGDEIPLDKITLSNSPLLKHI